MKIIEKNLKMRVSFSSVSEKTSEEERVKYHYLDESFIEDLLPWSEKLSEICKIKWNH